VTGANPADVRTNGGCAGDGDACYSSTTGEPTEWFLQTMDLVGVLALTAAAVLNVVFLRMLNTWRRNRKESLTYTPQWLGLVPMSCALGRYPAWVTGKT